MSLNPENPVSIKMLLETGTPVEINNLGILSLTDCFVFVGGFNDPSAVLVDLYGNDYRVLAPDSGLDPRDYRQTKAIVLKESGLPVIAFVKKEFRNGGEESETTLIAVNVNEPRQSVLVKGRSDELHVLDNMDWSDGGLSLVIYCEGHTGKYELQDLQVVKARGNYVLSLAEPRTYSYGA